MRRMLVRSCFALVAAALGVGCGSPVEYYCDESTPCLPRYPDRPFCDITGATPESAGIGNTCVSETRPADAGVRDANNHDATPDLTTIAITKSGNGTGTVISQPGGINCGPECTAQFATGTSISLAFVADEGSEFSGWAGTGCSGLGDCVINSSAELTATFTLERHEVTVQKTGDGQGTITSNPSAIDCGSSCSGAFDHGTSVVLSAVATGASVFAGWSGDGCSGASAVCNVTADRARTVGAAFDLNTYSLSVGLTGTGSGSVASDVGSISCPGVCSDSFTAATDVVLTATPDATSTFTGWAGACSGNGTCDLSMTAFRGVTANFERIRHLLTVEKQGLGSSSGLITSSPSGINCGADCSELFDANTAVLLSASVTAPGHFVGWSGAGCNGTGTCQVTMDQARTVTAQLCAPSAGVSAAAANGTFTAPVGLSYKRAQGVRLSAAASLETLRLHGAYSASAANGTLSIAVFEGGSEPDTGTQLGSVDIPLASTGFAVSEGFPKAFTDIDMTSLGLTLQAGVDYWLVFSADVNFVHLYGYTDSTAPVGECYDSGIKQAWNGSWTEAPDGDFDFQINPCAPLP